MCRGMVGPVELEERTGVDWWIRWRWKLLEMRAGGRSRAETGEEGSLDAERCYQEHVSMYLTLQAPEIWVTSNCWTVFPLIPDIASLSCACRPLYVSPSHPTLRRLLLVHVDGEFNQMAIRDFWLRASRAWAVEIALWPSLLPGLHLHYWRAWVGTVVCAASS